MLTEERPGPAGGISGEGDITGGRAFLAEALDREGPPSHHRALVLYADGLFAFRQGEMDVSRARNETALAWRVSSMTATQRPTLSSD